MRLVKRDELFLRRSRRRGDRRQVGVAVDSPDAAKLTAGQH